MSRYVVVQEYTHQNGYRDLDAVRDLHQCCDECAESESFDDDGSKVGDAAIRNVAYNTEEEEQIELRVLECFYYLVYLQVFILYTGLVLSQSFDGPSSLLLCQQRCCDW